MGPDVSIMARSRGQGCYWYPGHGASGRRSRWVLRNYGRFYRASPDIQMIINVAPKVPAHVPLVPQ